MRVRSEATTGEGVLRKRCSKKFRKFHRKSSALESLFNKVAGLKALLKILLKRDSNTGVSCEICKIFKNTYFEEHLRTTVRPALITAGTITGGSLSSHTSCTQGAVFEREQSPSLAFVA